MDLLYKYRHFSNPHHLKILSHGQIRFTPPLEFNDPHDCRIPILWEKADKNYLESEFREEAMCQHSGDSELSREAKVQEEIASMTDSTQSKLILEYQTRVIVSPRVGILSFSLDSAHPLMWSHYSNAHTGFTVGFNQSQLLNSIRLISGASITATSASPTPGLEIRPTRVNYPPKMPELIPKRGNEGEMLRTIVTTKSREWEYENEVRHLLMKFDDQIQPVDLTNEERIVTFPLDVIKEVTLGVNASDSDLKNVADILSDGRPHVRLWKASPSYGVFGLDREEIDY